MSLASWCVTLAVTLVQLVNLNTVKIVFISSFIKGSLAVAETEVLVLHLLSV